MWILPLSAKGTSDAEYNQTGFGFEANERKRETEQSEFLALTPPFAQHN